jgi:hypothetical protein
MAVPYIGGFQCQYHQTGYCYLKEGEIEDLDLKYSWISYDFEKIEIH